MAYGLARTPNLYDIVCEMTRPPIPRAQLDTVVHQIHREAVLSELASYGTDIDEWKPDAINSAIEAASEEVPTNAERGYADPSWSIVDLDGGNGKYVEGKVIEKPIYPVSILGSAGISLTNIYNLTLWNFPWEEVVRAPHREVDDPIRAVVAIIHPNRASGMFAFRREDRNSKVWTFLAPDLPPVAVREYALMSSARKYDMPWLEVGILDKVERDFGDKGMEFLSDDVCLGLIQALKRSKKKLETFEL